MIKQYTLKTLQIAFNKALTLDTDTSTKLQALQGKVLKVSITPLQVDFYIQFGTEGLILLAEYDAPPDTIIQSSPLGLIRLTLLPASKARSLFNDAIIITGDVELGQRIKHIFDQVDIDWEGLLAQVTGDVVAYRIGSFFRKSLVCTQQIKNSFSQSFTEYLQEEVLILPPKEALQDFFKDIDDLSLSVERLEAIAINRKLIP